MQIPNSTSQSLPFGAPQLRVLDAADSADFGSYYSSGDTSYMPVSGFLNRIRNDRPWGISNVSKFGGQVSRFADGLGCAYKGASDRKAGDVRIYPLEVLKAVYNEMASSLRWPALPADEPVTPAAELAEREVKDTVTRQLRMLVELAKEPATRAAAQKLLDDTERALATV